MRARHPRAWLLGGLLLLPTVLAAQTYSYIAFEQITVAGTAIGFTAATINQGSGHPAATIATCRLETAEIRYTVNGTTPTSSVGTILSVGDTLVLNGAQLIKLFKAIRTGSSGQLDCTYLAP